MFRIMRLSGALAGFHFRLVHLDTANQSERVVDAIRATTTDTDEDIAEMEADEAMTRRSLNLLNSKRNDAYEAALAALREDTQKWWADVLACDPDEMEEGEEPASADADGLRRFRIALNIARLPELLAPCLVEFHTRDSVKASGKKEEEAAN